MPIYIVRRTETHGLLGIFAVGELSDLGRHIGDCASPAECQYAEIDSGGVLWAKPGGRKIPAGQDGAEPEIDEAEDQEDLDPLQLLRGASLTESWQEAFYEDQHDWRPVPDVGDS